MPVQRSAAVARAELARIAAARRRAALQKQQREAAAVKRSIQKPKPAPAAPVLRRTPDSYISPAERRAVASEQRKNRARKESRRIAGEKRKLAKAGFPLKPGFAERIGKDIQTAAIGFPGGLYQVGKALTLDTADLARHPARKQYQRTQRIAETIGKQYAHDYRHPIRYARQHPGFVATDVLAALSAGAGTASRVNAAGRAAAEASAAGAGRGAVVRAALTRPSSEGGSLLQRALPKERTHIYQGQPIRGRESPNKAVAAMQRRRDRATGGRVSAGKAASLIGQEQRVLNAAEKGPTLKVAAAAKKFKKDAPKNLAVDVVGVGLSVDEHVRLLLKAAAAAKGKTRQQLARRAQLIDKHARRYIDESSGKPAISAEHPELARAVQHVREATTKTEADLARAGLLTPEGAATRRHAPGRVLLGAKYEAKSLAETPGAEYHKIGQRVRTSEGLRGAIVDISGDTASVRLWRKGNEVVDVPLEELYPASGRVKSGRLVGGGRAVKYDRPAEKVEAEARVAELQEKVDKTVDKLARAEMSGNEDLKLAAAATRGKIPRRAVPNAAEMPRFKKGGKVDIQRAGEKAEYYEPTGNEYTGRSYTTLELARKKVYDDLIARGKEPNAHPFIKGFNSDLGELESLKGNLAAHAESESGIWGKVSPLTQRYTERFQNVVDTDDVRRLIPEYARATNDEKALLASKYHEAASAGANRIYNELLEQPVKTGRVTIMGGGSGAGKTTARHNLGIKSANNDVILDATLSDAGKAAVKIEKALKSGRRVIILYIYRDPANAYVKGVLGEKRLAEEGRVVSIDEHARMHVESNATIRELAKKYEGKDVDIHILDNTREGSPEITLEQLPKLDYNEVRNEIAQAFQSVAPRLSEAQREAAGISGRVASVRQASGEGSTSGLERGAGGSQEGLSEFPLFGNREELASSVPYTGGEFYVPEQRTKVPGAPGAFRGGIPRKPGSLTNPYTGAARITGRNTHEVLRAITENLLGKQRYLAIERLRSRIVPMGERVKPADTRLKKFAPVRERPLTRSEAAQLHEALQNVEELTPDVASRLDAVVANMQESLFPERQYASVAPGTEIPGIVWVDRKLLGSQHKLIGSLGPVDVLQDAVKGLILYGKPGYVTPNMLGNAGFNLFQQGFLAPANWTRALRLDKDLAFEIDEIQGAGFARGLAEGTTSPLSGTVRWAGDFWSKFVDGPFRRASFIHEARLRGYKSEAELRDLIENQANRPLLGEVAQRARDAIVDYERMGPAERDVVRRILFIYPWLKGSTIYGGQFLRDHPIQTATFAAMGRQGEAESLKLLGPLPAWARGSFKVFDRGDQPYIINPNAVSPFSTPAQILQAAQGGFGSVERSENVGEMTSPVLQSAIEAAFGRDLFSGTELKGGYAENFAKQLGKGLPQVNLVRRELEAGNPETQEKTYPYGYLSAAGQFILGSSSPRPANLEKLNEQAMTLNPVERAKKRNAEEQKAVIAGLRQHAPGVLTNNPGLSARIDEAYDRKQAVEALRSRVKLDVGTGEPYARAVLVEEARLLRKWGVISPAKVTQITKAAKTGSLDDVLSWRGALSEGFEDQYLALLREAREEAGVK